MTDIDNRIVNLPKELLMLLACCRTFIHPEDSERIRLLSRCEINWDLFSKLVDRHRVVGIIYRSLRRFGGKSVPEYILRSLKKRLDENARKVLLLTAELVRLLDLLEANGIHVLAIKGPALSMQLYGELGLRCVGDLDLLVPPEEVAPSEHLLYQNGYRRVEPDFSLSPVQRTMYKRQQHHFGYYCDDRLTRVELHYRWCRNPYLFPLDINKAWERCQFVTIAGRQVKTPGIEDNILYLCAHGGSHGWFQVFWLCDVAQFLKKHENMDWYRLIDSAGKFCVSRALAEGFVLSNLFFNSKLPEEVLIYSKKDKTVRNLARLAMRFISELSEPGYRPFTSLYVLKKLYDFRLQKGLRYKIFTCLKNVTAVPNDWRVVPLPDVLFPLYYALRPFLWFWRHYCNIRKAKDSGSPCL